MELRLRIDWRMVGSASAGAVVLIDCLKGPAEAALAPALPWSTFGYAEGCFFLRGRDPGNPCSARTAAGTEAAAAIAAGVFFFLGFGAGTGAAIACTGCCCGAGWSSAGSTAMASG